MQRRIFLLLLAASALLRAQTPRPHVLLISIDGFRYDYAAKHGAPNLTRLGEQGVRAEALIPQFPSTTFPNHYSIITGLRPEHDGIIENVFFDPARGSIFRYNRPETSTDGSWYKGTPLWVLAEKQGVRTAAFFWPGADAEIQGIRPRDYRRYEQDIPNEERVRQVIDWFARPESVRPHFVTLYFSDVDSAGHDTGPDSPQTRGAVRKIDALLGQLMEGLRASGTPVNVFVVSDHGMIHPTEYVRVGAQGEFAGFEMATTSGADLRLYTKDKALAQTTLAKLNQLDQRVRATLVDDGQILITPTRTNLLYIEQPGGGAPKLPAGTHGFDTQRVMEMRGIFYAQGPDLKTGIALPAFQNIDVYPAIAKLLRLTPPAELDGNPNTLTGILK